MAGMTDKRSPSVAATRARILDAAIELVETEGVGAATTKRIAAVAKVSEGSLYNHFADKPELLITLVLERLPGIREVFGKLYGAGGTPTAARLAAALVALIDFYTHAHAIVAGVTADPVLLKMTRQRFAETGQGPHLAHEKLAEFLSLEQKAGRIRAGVRPEIAAALLIGACTEYASLRQMTGKTPGNLKKTAYANTVIEGLAPMLFPAK
jgi:AcrR family transcriptional regulator